LELARELVRLRREGEAIDAFLRAAESGEQLRGVARAFFSPRLRDAINSEQVARLAAVATASPESSDAQIAVGAALLEAGELLLGRRFVRRGYRMSIPELVPPAEADPEDGTPSLRPSFFVIGPHKSGTTSLNALIVQHPRVIAAPRKELKFWGMRRRRAAEVYDAYFPPVDPASGFVIGDASPTYLTSREAAQALGERQVEGKAIVLHRDPIARAYSHFQMHARGGGERRSWEEAVERELEVLGPTPPLQLADFQEIHTPYLGDSCLVPYLRMWLEAVGPERLMVVETAQLAQQRDETLAALFGYLGLPPAQIPDTTDRMVGTYSPMSAEMSARLREWFAPHEAELDRLLAGHAHTIPAGRGQSQAAASAR
jgi:hypothetical protein